MTKKELIFLLIILGIAAFFRFWQLDSIPPGLYPDEAIYANDAISNPGKIFYPENNGREGLYINLLALSFSVFGISIFTLKIIPAFFGTLTVLGQYLLTRELFNKNIALLSSFFLAVSFWHINFSRIGFRAILLPFILVFAFYFLFRGFRQKRIFNFIASGIFFGLGFYTYISYRFIVILLPLVLLFWWLIYRQRNLQKFFIRNTLYLLLIILIVSLPIGIYFLWHPQYFISRAAPISIFAAENPLKEFGKSLILHLGMFNFYGDPNWRHNFAGSPMLFWPIGILFLIGIALSIKELINFQRHKNLALVISHLSLVIWFLIMLLPGILTVEGIPHALRTIGAIPPVYILAGLGGWKAYQWFDKNVKNKKLLLVACCSLLVAITFVQFDKYFVKWAKKPEVKDAFSADYVEIGNYLNSLPKEIPKYVIVNVSGVPVPYPNGLPMPAQTVMFIESTKYGNPQSIYLLPEDLGKIKIEENAVVIKMRYE